MDPRFFLHPSTFIDFPIQNCMGSRMPDLLVIPRMDKTLHYFFRNTPWKNEKPTSQRFLIKQMDVSQKIQRPKWPQCQDLSIPILLFHFFIKKSIKIEGLEENRGSIMHPYFWLWCFHHFRLVGPIFLLVESMMEGPEECHKFPSPRCSLTRICR